MPPSLSSTKPPQDPQVEIWDQIFIRSRRSTVNALVAEVGGWGAWWPGLTVRRQVADRYVLHITPPRPHLPQRLWVDIDRIRPRDKGLEFSVWGDVEGTGEWFHLDEPEGVVVHYLLRGHTHKRSATRWTTVHRRFVRNGMNDLKRRLEAGRTPGAEPHPQLITHQARELAIYAREVAAHQADAAARPSAQGAR